MGRARAMLGFVGDWPALLAKTPFFFVFVFLVLFCFLEQLN